MKNHYYNSTESQKPQLSQSQSLPKMTFFDLKQPKSALNDPNYPRNPKMTLGPSKTCILKFF